MKNVNTTLFEKKTFIRFISGSSVFNSSDAESDFYEEEATGEGFNRTFWRFS